MDKGSRAVGNFGERVAARFLSRKGYRIVGRNVKTYVGEIDIVAKKGPSLIFVEIKTRKSLSFGPPYLAITWKKKKKLIQCARCYLAMKNISGVPWNIDVVSIEIKRIFWFIKRAKVEHFEEAIEDNDK